MTISPVFLSSELCFGLDLTELSMILVWCLRQPQLPRVGDDAEDVLDVPEDAASQQEVVGAQGDLLFLELDRALELGEVLIGPFGIHVRADELERLSHPGLRRLRCGLLL